MDLCRLTATEGARRIAAGDISAEDWVRDCLARIAERERIVHAWAFLDPDHALRQARSRDRAKRPLGRLHGVPVGIKDIIDTADMPTEYNSPIYRGHRPRRDAECVARLRAAGAIILGKTQTSEFAFLYAAPTRNPHNPKYTSGGSSSGSAAGVGDFMMPLALGTQTGGSAIRPASWCGVFGFTSTYRRISVAGVKPAAPSFDTIAEMARSVEDLILLDTVLSGASVARDKATSRRRPRIGYCRTPFWAQTERSMRTALSRTVHALRAAGFVVEDVELPQEFGPLSDGFRTVVKAEAVWALGPEYRDHRTKLSRVAQRLVEEGSRLDADAVQQVRAVQMHCALAIDRVFDRYDAILTPAAPGEAGKGNAVGNNVFNRPWTAMHLPCLTIPAGTGPAGLPVGVQFVGRRNADRALLALGHRIARIIEG